MPGLPLHNRFGWTAAILSSIVVVAISLTFEIGSSPADEPPNTLPTVKYNNPGLVVDLHVGLWAYPIPTDFDNDGDIDLLVCCPDKPMQGVYYFENTTGDVERPVFAPPIKLGPPHADLTPSYRSDGGLRLLSRNHEILDITQNGFRQRRQIYPTAAIQTGQPAPKLREQQWSFVDFDGDGRDDLIAGLADWTDYGMEFGREGWKDGYDDKGLWRRGPLHGYVYWIRNEGTQDKPRYAAPVRLTAGDEVIDVYGRPSPCFADFDSDGDLDLICGEFLDGFTYYENVGTRSKPIYAPGRRLQSEGQNLTLDLQMIVPVAFDWNRDGHVDLIVGDEDGRVAYVKNTGRLDRSGLPLFEPPYYFQQQADDLVFGALATPVSVDWDGDGDDDLIVGNSAGYIGWFENLDGGNPPRFAAVQRLQADDQTIRILAGLNGSCQGPSETKWGYTAPSVADWDGDGLPDLVINSVWGKVLWYQNIGTRAVPRLTAARPIEVEWDGPTPKPEGIWWTPQGRELVAPWRTTPLAIDWDGDGLTDLVMLDQEGYLVWYPRQRTEAGLRLMPGRRIFVVDGPSGFDSAHRVRSERPGLLQLNVGTVGNGGRRKLAIVEWNGDGHRDFVVNSVNVNILLGQPDASGTYRLRDSGPVSGHVLAGHTTSPTTVDWNRDGVPDLLIGAEDGRLYYLENPRTSSEAAEPHKGDPER